MIYESKTTSLSPDFEPAEVMRRSDLAGTADGISKSWNTADIAARVSEIHSGSADTESFIHRVGLLALEVTGGSNFAFLLRDPITGAVQQKVVVDVTGVPPLTDLLLDGVAGRVLDSGTSLAVNRGQVQPEPGDFPWSVWAAVPIRSGSRIRGVLSVYERSDGRELWDHLGALESVADAAAALLERDRIEAAIRESESRYRMLFDHAPDGIMITDPSGRILDVNASLCRMLGYSHNQLLKLTETELLEPSDIEMVQPALKFVSERQEFRREWKFLRNSGEVVETDVSATQMPNGNILAIVRDLSENRRAEIERERLLRELSEHQRRLDDTVANIPGVVWETKVGPDGNRILTFVSDYVTEMTGYSVEECLATPNFWRSIVHPDHVTTIADRPDAFPVGETRVREFPLIARDGRMVWVEAHWATLPDEAGNVGGTRGVMIDITNRKQSENALRNSEERYRDLVENALDIIYVHDLDGKYISVNKAAERITGYTRNEILLMDMTQTVAPEYLEKAKRMISEKLNGGETTAYELEIIAKNGNRVALEVNTRLMFENGVPVAVQGIARDVTERRVLEEKYNQAQKMEAIGLLAGGIAHDFNNLLTAITGYSEITLARMDADEPLRSNVEEIRQTGERAAALTRQLLAFSRKQLLKPVVHDVNEVVRSMENMLRRLIPESIEFDFALADDLECVEADPGQLSQVVLNLVVNARDAMPRGGRLSISTENAVVPAGEGIGVQVPPGNYVKLVVADDGEGIDEEILDRVFDPFFTTKPSGKGTGLGLSTVHGIIKQSGGEVFVSSRKGSGATFVIYLPAAGRLSLSQNDLQREPFTGGNGGETILLAEDDVTVGKLVKTILTDSGYNVLEARSGADALAICSTHPAPIHLLLTDLVMPNMSGVELAERVAMMHPDAKAIVMTGHAKESLDLQPLADLKVPILDKPFTPDVLLQKIGEVLLDRSSVRH